MVWRIETVLGFLVTAAHLCACVSCVKASRFVGDFGGGFVGGTSGMGENTKVGGDWWVLGEMRILAMTNNPDNMPSEGEVGTLGP